MRELDSKLDDMDANKVMEDTLMNDMPDMQDIGELIWRLKSMWIVNKITWFYI